jgi:hypothetical protein
VVVFFERSQALANNATPGAAPATPSTGAQSGSGSTTTPPAGQTTPPASGNTTASSSSSTPTTTGVSAP